MRRKKGPRAIAPRLANGEKRIPIGHGLPEEIKDGIREIAFKENKSVSWVLEQIIIEYFGFDSPEYTATKGNKDAAKDIKQEARTLPHRARTAKAS